MGFIAQAVSEGANPWILFGSSGALVAVIALFVNSSLKNQRATEKVTALYDGPIKLLQEQTQRQETRIGVLEAHVRRCERANDALIRTVEQNGLELPVDVLLWRRRDND